MVSYKAASRLLGLALLGVCVGCLGTDGPRPNTLPKRQPPSMAAYHPPAARRPGGLPQYPSNAALAQNTPNRDGPAGPPREMRIPVQPPMVPPVGPVEPAVPPDRDTAVGPGSRGPEAELAAHRPVEVPVPREAPIFTVFRRELDPRVGAWELIRTALGYTLTLPLDIPLYQEPDYVPRAIDCLMQCLMKTDV